MIVTPTDEQILAAIRSWGGTSMTYVIASRLRAETQWVLRQLKRLEREGKVSRAPSSYRRQLCWKVNEEALS